MIAQRRLRRQMKRARSISRPNHRLRLRYARPDQPGQHRACGRNGADRRLQFETPIFHREFTRKSSSRDPDHLNTPRLIANSAGTTVWRWDQGEPFGNDVPNENPSGLGTLVVPLRFPGQYFDRETSLAYNVFRDYDPTIGRYVRSDPIGLVAGLNPYLYVRGSPLTHVDPLGLETVTGWGCYLSCMVGFGSFCPVPVYVCKDVRSRVGFILCFAAIVGPCLVGASSARKAIEISRAMSTASPNPGSAH